MIYIFFFNDTATTEIYTFSLHDALPIFEQLRHLHGGAAEHGTDLDGDVVDRLQIPRRGAERGARRPGLDRKSTRLNSSHANISYAVFCLKKKNITLTILR